MKYESLGAYRSAVSLAFIIVGICYLHCHIPTMAPDATIFPSIIYGAEIYGFMITLLHLMLPCQFNDDNRHETKILASHPGIRYLARLSNAPQKHFFSLALRY